MPNKPIILIADDDPDDQMLIRDAIEDIYSSNLQIDSVWNGIELLAYLREKADGSEKPALILLDLNMPLKDGRAALQEIRDNPFLADIPVAVLTTARGAADAAYCQKLGVTGFYTKPGSMTELREIIQDLGSNHLA